MEAESLTACPLYSVKKVWYLIFRSRRMFSRSLQIPPDQSTFAGTGVGIYNKIVHEFLPYVLFIIACSTEIYKHLTLCRPEI